jgi:uncharacterized protein (TIGR00730 family)
VSVEPAVRHQADSAFSVARRRAAFQRIWGLLTGQARGHLLSFEEVRDRLNIRGQHYAGVQTIPIEKIAGTVGRYQEFNRAFLPTQEFIRERWKGVYTAAHSAAGLPPIDVYQIGDVYFVRDGHHRVSVLKELGATTVEAVVTELETPIRLSSDVDEADLDLKAEYAAFLAETGLAELLPEQRIEFTLPGQYHKLLEHIAVHRYFVGLREQREIPYSEAVARWYQEVYGPVVLAISEEGLLAQFPQRTAADLYLWIVEHRHYLNERYGQDVPLEEAAADFSKEFGSRAAKKQLEAGVKRAKEAGKKPKKPLLVAVFGSGSAAAEPALLDQAERLGRLLAEAGFAVLNGGYGGTMEAVSRGAAQAGGLVIGVTMDLFAPRLQPNPWLSQEERVTDFFPRLQRLTGADAFVLLQGGIGTLTEAALTWSLLQTGQISPRPFVFVGECWARLFEALRAELLFGERDLALTTVVGSVDEALARLRDTLAPTP